MASHYTCIMNDACYNDDIQGAKHMVTYIIPMPCWGDRPRDVIPQVLGADALALSPPFSGDDEMGRSDRWQHRGQDEKRPRLTLSEEAERKARHEARVLGFRFRVQGFRPNDIAWADARMQAAARHRRRHEVSAPYAGGKQRREQPLMLVSIVSFAASAADDERDDSVVVDQSA